MAAAVRPKRVPTKRSGAQYQTAKAQLGQPVTSVKQPPTAAAQAYQQALQNLNQVNQTVPVPSTTTPAQPKTKQGPGFLNQRVSLGRSGYAVGAPSEAPSFGGGEAPATLTRYSKGTSTRLIIVALGVGGAAIIIGGNRFPAYTSNVNGKNVKVPGTLHAFAGLLIAGTIALIVNEVAPDLGMALAIGLIFIAIGDAKVFVNLGDRIFGKNTPAVGGGKTASGGGYPTSKAGGYQIGPSTGIGTSSGPTGPGGGIYPGQTSPPGYVAP
jgi:hypothetical protein